MRQDKFIDIKQTSIFPTLIWQFNHTYEFDDELPKMLKVVEERSTSMNVLGTLGKEKNNLDNHPYFRLLAKTFYNVCETACNTLRYEGEVEITEMWANRLIPGKHDYHEPHVHGNSIFSGVFYLKSNESAGIRFVDPRPQSKILQPRVSEYNEHTSMNLSINSTPGTGVLFPSWLQHYVPRTDEERISVSFNALIRGKYGQKGSLAELKI